MSRIPIVEPTNRQLGFSQATQRIRTDSPLQGIAEAVTAGSAMLEQANARDAETAAAKNFSDLQIRLAERERELQTKMQEKPDNFTAKLLEAADKEFQGSLGQMSDNKYYREAMIQRWNQYRAQVAGRGMSFEAQRKNEIQLARLEQSGTNLYNLAYQDPGQYQTALMQLEGNMAMAKATGLIPNAESALQKQKDSIGYAVFRGALDREDYQTARQFLSPDVLGEQFDNASQQYLRAQEHHRSKARVEVNRTIRSIDEAVSNEIPIAPEVFNNAKLAAENAGDAEAVQAIMDLFSLQDEMIDAKSKTIAELVNETEMEKARIGSGEFERMRSLAAKQRILGSRVKAVESGQFLEYLEANGSLPETGFADISKPEEFAQILEQRRASYLTIAEREGIPLNVLKKEERESLKKAFDTADSQQSAAMLSTLSRLVNKDEMPILAEQFMPTSPEMAAAFSLAADAPVDALKIIEGTKRILPSDIKRSELKQAISEKLGQIIRDAESTKQVTAAVEGYYKQRHFETGASDGIDNELLDEAIEKVVGTPIEVGGQNSRIISFRIAGERYADEETVNNLIDGLTPEILQAVIGSVPLSLDGTPVDMELIKNRAQFFTVGEGRYQVGYYDSQTGQINAFLDSAGNPYELDLRAVYEYVSTTSNPVLDFIKARQRIGLRRSRDAAEYRAEYDRVLRMTDDRAAAKAAADELQAERARLRRGETE